MPIDYGVPEFQLLIGTFDVTDYVKSISISTPIAELGQTLDWSGSFELKYNQAAIDAGIAESEFIQFDTPGRWRPDQQPVKLLVEGYPVCTLRIKKYAYQVQKRVGKGELYSILDVAVGNKPAEPTVPDAAQILKDNPGMTLAQYNAKILAAQPVSRDLGGVGMPLQKLVDFLLDQAYRGATLNPIRTLGTITGDMDSKVNSNDPIADAQKLVSTNYAWLHTDPMERIATVQGAPELRPVLFARSLSQVEIEPDLDAIDFAAEQVIVTGSHEVATLPELKLILLPKPDKDSHTEDGRPLNIVTQTYKKKADLFPEGNTDSKGRPTDTSEVLAEIKTIRYVYKDSVGELEIIPQPTADNDPGATASVPNTFPQTDSLRDLFDDRELMQTITTWQRCRGVTFADVYPNDTSLSDAEMLVETFYCKFTKLPKGVIYPDAYPGDTTLDLSSIEGISNGRVNPDGTIPTQEDPKTGKAKALEKPYKREYTFSAPEVNLQTKTLKGEVKLQPIGWTPFRQKPYKIDVGFVPSQAHIDNLALQIANREVRRRDAHQIIMPIPREWLAAGCPLLVRAQIHDAEYQVDGVAIAISEKKCLFSFAGGRIGKLPSPIPEPASPPPFIYPDTPDEIAIAIPSTVQILAGNQIVPLQLIAVGGNP